MSHILLLDNYDSFTYNLEHYLRVHNAEVTVVRNDEELPPLAAFSGVVLSPGPGLPAEAGRMMQLIDEINGEIPVLGVCLGMQGIAEYLGGELYNQDEVKHGVQEVIQVLESPLFTGINNEMNVGLYHSWAVQPGKGDFEVVAKSKTGTIMAIQSPKDKLFGVQFHPESIMTEEGLLIIKNFLDLAG